MRGNSSASRYGSYRYNADRYSRGYYSSSNQYNARYNNRYNYTSEAFDFDYDMPRPVRKPKSKSSKYKRVREGNLLSSKKTIPTIFVIFGLVLTLLCIYASNSLSKNKIVELQDKLEQAKIDVEYLNVSIENNLDLERIKNDAMKLGLQLPAEYQIVEIDVPKDSYTVQYGNESKEKEENLFSFIRNWF